MERESPGSYGGIENLAGHEVPVLRSWDSLCAGCTSEYSQGDMEAGSFSVFTCRVKAFFISSGCSPCFSDGFFLLYSDSMFAELGRRSYFLFLYISFLFICLFCGMCSFKDIV